MSNGLLLLFAALLVLLNGFFVTAEYALVKIRSTQIEELVEKGSAAARVVRFEHEHLQEFISTTQLGITLCTLGLGWAGEGTVERLLEPLIHRLGLTLTPRALTWISAGLAFALITSIHMVVGEQVPKMLAIERAERVALVAAYPLRIFYRIFRFPVWVLSGATGILARLLGLQKGGHDVAHSEDEVLMILGHLHEGGKLRESKLDLVEHVFGFADKRAREIMTPRVDMVYLSTDWPFERNFELATSHSFTRFPLCHGDPDRVAGLIHVRDLLRIAREPDPDIHSIRRDIVVVPETKPIDHLLREFQRRKLHMAVVLDEYGGTAGIVTLEDVLEQLVGDIHDEFEEPVPEVRRLSDRQYLVDGKTPVSDLRTEFDLEIPGNGSNGADTIGGWILDHAGAIPEIGTVLEAGPYRLEVTEMAGHRIRKVLITESETPPGEEEKSAATEDDSTP